MTAKMTHREAHYRISDSPTKRCGTCSMYHDSNMPSCDLVIKPIRPHMVCDYYDQKNAHTQHVGNGDRKRA